MSLELDRVTKEFDVDGVRHVALSDVTLAFDAGSFCTLLGPSGCGKTTLLRLIAGFEHPTRGEIRHDGRVLNSVPPYRRGFPMVFQSYALFPHMTVRENVAYGLRLRRLRRDRINDRVDRALTLLDIRTQHDRYPAQMSGGQQQRVALARALVLEPTILLLDEPLSNLDAELRATMRSEIRALQQRLAITAIYVTHDQEEALAISDRIVVLNHGRIEQIGTPFDIVQQPRSEFVARFMGCPNIYALLRIAPDRIMLFGEPYAIAKSLSDADRVVVPLDAVQLRGDEGRHRARVSDVSFLGTRTLVRLQLADGTRITIAQPALMLPTAGSAADGTAVPLATGDIVGFDVAPDRLLLVRTSPHA